MLMVIFGAGASYDSVPPISTRHLLATVSEIRCRPPLASELFEVRDNFDEAAAAFPRSRPLISLLRVASETAEGPVLEAELEKYQQEANDYPRRFAELLSLRFYLQRVLLECSQWHDLASGISNYLGLLSRVDTFLKQGEEICFVTFNYDLLMEKALVEFKGSPTSIDWYISGSHKLLKVHGSVNWGRVVRDRKIDPAALTTEDQIREQMIEDAPYFIGEGVSQIYELSTSVVAGDASSLLFPAIALPVQGKTEQSFECPEEHLQLLRERIPATTRLLVIGWRGTENHFLELWRAVAPKATPRVLIVSGSASAAKETAENLIAGGLGGSIETSPLGFSGWLGSGTIDGFLTN